MIKSYKKNNIQIYVYADMVSETKLPNCDSQY